MDAMKKEYDRPALYDLFQRLEFVRLIDKYGLRGAEKEKPKAEKKMAALPRCDEMPAEGLDCAVYIAEDGTLAVTMMMLRNMFDDVHIKTSGGMLTVSLNADL